MTPAPRALWGALVGALAVGLLLGWTPAGAATPEQRAVAARADGDRVVFTGTIVRRPQVTVQGAATVRRYQVAVTAVYGPGSVTTERVTVRSRAALESCPSLTAGTQGPTRSPSPTQPASPTTTPPAATVDKRLRLFDATVDGGEYVVGCRTVTLVDDAVLADLTRQYGEGRPPGRDVEPVAPLEDVGYQCPDTGDAVDLDDPDSCVALDDDQSLDRAAAPGLALVIVGVLGLLVVRRIGRRA
ncbi:hypothetical protein [Nocardioides rubriscoriae]|uniref:hypothetical protein n=1 Tax=Nocardioides rubriscoriae TaxID=642762 RepID=UPI0011DF5536|nr:hypothetical protein [Nocardioides rubriscoriae]